MAAVKITTPNGPVYVNEPFTVSGDADGDTRIVDGQKMNYFPTVTVSIDGGPPSPAQVDHGENSPVGTFTANPVTVDTVGPHTITATATVNPDGEQPDVVQDTVSITASLRTSQSNWRWCKKCQGLWFGGAVDAGHCPAGGNHVMADSGDYSLDFEPAAGQPNWRWCHKCQGIWYAISYAALGVCPAGGSHSQIESWHYILRQGPASGQDNWRWCHKCQGLWYNGGQSKGVCPGWQENQQEPHESTESADYLVPVT